MTTIATNQTDFLSRGVDLVKRGFSIIPLAAREKKPVGIGATGRTRDLEVIKTWAQTWPDANVGICADDDITILESDDASRLREILNGMGVALPETATGGASENRPHWFFRRTPECGDGCMVAPGLFEFRNVNQYVVGPGSIHPSGSEYRWWNNAPVAVMPTGVLDALREIAAEYRGDGDPDAPAHIQPGPYTKLRHEYLRHLDPEDMLKLDDLEVTDGERHYTLMSLAGLLHDGERSADDIAEILRDVRDRYFSEGKGDEEIESIAAHAVRRDPLYLEPRELPIAYSFGTIIFRDAEAMAKWHREHADDFSTDWAAFRTETIPEPRVLIRLNNETMLREGMLAEVFAYRGVGKSMFVVGLVNILTKGGDFCGLTSVGGHRVMLVDGELPEKLLQQRLDKLVGPLPAGMLRVRSLRNTKNACMKPLVDRTEQDAFMERLKGWRPDVIIFDTKTTIFKHDTNDQPQLLAVNEFLMRLRAEGFTVITTHHAGKNGTQRGRTDNDDNMDLIVQLKAPKGWTPGDGMQFILSFEKVRYADRLEGFGAKFTEKGWELDTFAGDIIGLLIAGKGIRAIAKELGVGVRMVTSVKLRAEKNGTVFPETKAGRKTKAAEQLTQV